MKKTAAIILTFVLAFCLTVSAFAANFTPSVSQKGSPNIVEIRIDGSKQKFGGVIKNSYGAVIKGVPSGDIIVTPISEVKTANEDIKEILEDAKDTISNDKPIAEIIPEFEEKLTEVYPDAKPEEMVVKDLFDVALYGTYAEYLAEDGNTLSIIFDAGINKDAPFVAVFSADGKNWSVVESSLIKHLENGQVEIVLSEPGVVAFLVEAGSVPVGPVSPQTSDSALSLACAGAVCILAGCAFITRSKKSK